MKRLFTVFTLLSLLAMPAVAQAKVGVVSFEEVLAKTRQGKKISKTIEGYFKRKQASINRRKKGLQVSEKEIVKAFKTLEASKTILKGSVYKARKDKLEARYRKLLLKGQRLMAKVGKENEQLNQKRYKLLQPLRATFLATVKSVAAQKALDIVIEKSALYFFKAAIDITGTVVTRINAVTKN